MEWYAALRLSPMGEDRADMRAAYVAATTVNANIRRKSVRPHKAEEHVGEIGLAFHRLEEKRKQHGESEEHAKQARKFAARFPKSVRVIHEGRRIRD